VGTGNARKEIQHNLQQFAQIYQEARHRYGDDLPHDTLGEAWMLIVTGYAQERVIDGVSLDRRSSCDSKVSTRGIEGKITFAEKLDNSYPKAEEIDREPKLHSYLVTNEYGSYLVTGFHTGTQQYHTAQVVKFADWQKAIATDDVKQLRQQVLGQIAVPVTLWPRDLREAIQGVKGKQRMQALWEQLAYRAGQGDPEVVRLAQKARTTYQRAENVMKKNEKNLIEALKQQAQEVQMQYQIRAAKKNPKLAAKIVAQVDPKLAMEVAAQELLRQQGFSKEQIEEALRPLQALLATNRSKR
jgi:hypothetical protein